jgi:hypothetical protein
MTIEPTTPEEIEQAKEQYFLEVPDKLRDMPSQRDKPTTPVRDALRAGKTVFVPLFGRRYRQVVDKIRTHPAAKRQGFRERVRSLELDGEPGVLAWWVKVE